MRIITSLSLVSWLCLSACSMLAVKPQNYNTDRQVSQLSKEQNWQFSGKMSVRFEQQLEKVNIDWQQKGESYIIKLSFALGLGEHVITGNPDWVEISGSHFNGRASSMQQLLAQFTALKVPLQFFPYWVKGLAKPEGEVLLSYQQQNAQLQWLQQQNWQVSFSDFEVRKFYQMPNKVKLTYIAANADYKQSATLLINKWMFN